MRNTFRVMGMLLGYVPFVWLLLFIMEVVLYSIYLGQIPYYGLRQDPYSIPQYNFLHIAEFLVLLISIPSVIVWAVVNVLGFLTFRKNYTLDKWSTWVYFIGLAGFFVFYFAFPEIFLWVRD